MKLEDPKAKSHQSQYFKSIRKSTLSLATLLAADTAACFVATDAFKFESMLVNQLLFLTLLLVQLSAFSAVLQTQRCIPKTLASLVLGVIPILYSITWLCQSIDSEQSKDHQHTLVSLRYFDKKTILVYLDQGEWFDSNSISVFQRSKFFFLPFNCVKKIDSFYFTESASWNTSKENQLEIYGKLRHVHLTFDSNGDLIK